MDSFDDQDGSYGSHRFFIQHFSSTLLPMQCDNPSLPESATSLKDIHTACKNLCRQFGFDQFLYISKRTDTTPPKLSIINGGDHTKKVVSHNGILRVTRSDKTAHQDVEQLLSAFPGEFKQEIARFLLEPSLTRPLVSSLSFPIEFDQHHHAILVLSSSMHDSQPKISDAQVSKAKELALGIHQAANKLIKDGEVTPEIKLTSRELECLQWAAAGKTNWEIGTILGVTQRTVRFHLINAADKLNTSNRYHTVAQAITLGLVKAG